MPSFAPNDNIAERAPIHGPSPEQPPEPSLETDRRQTSDPGSRCPMTDNQSTEAQKPNITCRDFMENNCRYSDDCTNPLRLEASLLTLTPGSDLERPLGWARLAAMPDYVNNADIFRTYSYLSVRLIQYSGGRLAFLQAKLDEYDQRENIHLRGLTGYQTRVPGCPEVQGEYDLLMEAMVEEYLQYTRLVSGYKQMLQLHPVPRPHYEDMLGPILRDNMLNMDGLMWMNSPDEACSVSKPLPKVMVWLLHCRLIKRLLRSQAESGSRFIPLNTITILHQAFVTLQALTPLITIGILFLGGLTKAQSFGVVVGSTAFFSFAITATQEMDMQKALQPVCALGAVFVAVMVFAVPP
ncbi:hypothetical protein B0H67DRAFT_187688 [Lasiosphaeris hirsuta]|uniref:DUF6594 domain-containing protein n=1 Tax=Lasiosphaeris hirsuta TaxID=260670 RepID=A0AA40AR58_9PEZI|nr:hypothetical protein B0H67DRAFT_187688 [Lasiosphaeris hirsuta]